MLSAGGCMSSPTLGAGSLLLLCLVSLPAQRCCPSARDWGGGGVRLKGPGLPEVGFASQASPGGAGPSVAWGWTRATDVQELVPVRNWAETLMGFPTSLRCDCVGSWALAAFLSKH